MPEENVKRPSEPKQNPSPPKPVVHSNDGGMIYVGEGVKPDVRATSSGTANPPPKK